MKEPNPRSLTIEEHIEALKRTQASASKAHLKHKYGLTAEEFVLKLKLQGYRCAICGEVFDPTKGGKRPCVDHDHVSGKLRGLLCHGCNLKLAAVDDIFWLERAFDYIQKWLTTG